MEKPISKKQKVWRVILVTLLFCVFFVGMYLVLKFTGLIEYVNSVEKIKNLIDKLGFWGRFIFVLMQFLQVTFIPIPSTIVVVAGTIVYGPAQAALLSLSGILLGSAFAFFLGRVFGRKLVTFMVGKETCDKWVKFLSNGKYSFVIMMLLPFFPDDVLCLVAGVTDMTWAFFVITQLITRTIGIYLTCYFSSGQIIPYHGWGLVFWVGFFIFAIASIYLTTKYKDKIESWVGKVFKAKK